ncbi:phosphoribosyl-ATP pyrophosphohydrolase [Fadolivirus algeromassiliense]|jgi:NTP pyrophosphatase (non-canonical NTP hydrolase)|uniref:Phosphoribosyl-ATP pyrophosphohydrolase n=1 Tax=Fadolivirus FV1/VV64 TaxID=3070911 RepID=A0A7D3UUP9_9VIRU|nr:phosphoribosyl-ATP pyrophosphohydrolase [Fadolivirus algeromassiliense]QKF94271.1 phosphoribosyl-ATP pyrophosphohydrolase [Fadolivirus FV1/VV64]
MASNFEKVVDFNYQFGVLPSKELNPKPDVIEKDPNLVEFCLKLIREEVKELEHGVKTNDYVETVDALADILYVVYGMGCRIGVDMDKAFSLVHDNNMSKLCKTEEEAQRSVKYYEDNKAKLGYDSPAYRLAPDGVHWVVYNQSTKKVLKSIEWKPVDLTSVCK